MFQYPHFDVKFVALHEQMFLSAVSSPRLYTQKRRDKMNVKTIKKGNATSSMFRTGQIHCRSCAPTIALCLVARSQKAKR